MKRRSLTRLSVLMVCIFMGSALPAHAVIPLPHTIFPLQCWDGCLQDDPGRFGGMWWGQSLAEVKGMKYVASDPINVGESYYVRQGDVLELSGIKLEYLQYGFWNGLFSSLAYGTQGEKNWFALRQICFDNFGRWYQPDKTRQKYYWTGRHSAMTLEYNEVTETAQLYVYSKTIYERQRAAARQGYRW